MATLRIKAENLGTVSEVRNFLTDMEAAYNSLYAFDLLVELLKARSDRKRRAYDDKYYMLSELERVILLDSYIYGGVLFPNLVQLQAQLDISKLVLPEDQLVLSKVNIQSPGFWDFAGLGAMLTQIREYLKDRHERKKDKDYRNRQEEKRGDLDNQIKQTELLQKQIETLRNIGYSEVEIRQMVGNLVTKPLNQLGTHQTSGLIEAPIDETETEDNDSSNTNAS